MPNYTELEINLQRRDPEHYGITLRFSRPDSEVDVRLPQNKLAYVQFHFQTLQDLTDDPVAYGQALTQGVFHDEAIRVGFAQAQIATQSLNIPMRVRLGIDPNALELHSLHWETLRDPEQDVPLLTGEQILFSRYLSSFDWRPVQVRPKTQLKTIVMIANPVDLGEYQFAPIEVADELNRAQQSLATLNFTALANQGQATAENLLKHLHQEIDILYLVCHGALVQGEPWLWLENAEGKTVRFSGIELTQRLRELSTLPRLIILVSCQSAGTGETYRHDTTNTLIALGPRLAEAGVPAVLAMQGKITMNTMAEFMPVFFHELLQDGQIDRAVAVARGAIRNRFDHWMPVLFMRLKNGRIWYVPGFGNQTADFEKWPALLNAITETTCTPILGTGLSETLLGTRREIANHWAEEYHFPLSPHHRDELPRVAQYLAVNQSALFPRKSFREFLTQELRNRYPEILANLPSNTSLEELLTMLGNHSNQQVTNTPYQILAQLPFPIYITTDPSDLLADALKAVGKEPRTELCRWNSYVMRLPSLYDDQPKYRPTAECPLVYQLFGNIKEPRSLVLTEDDYFNYLIGVTRNKDLIPRAVRAILADSTLLFLGFYLDDWDFRILFHSIMNQEGSERLNDYAHVAVQIEPEEGKILEPERAHRYLESYFQNAKISIYWGNVKTFTQEIHQRWRGKSASC